MVRQQVNRYEIPISGDHDLEIYGEVLWVNCAKPDVVEFWALTPPGGTLTPSPRRFAIFSTGQPLPSTFMRYWGSAVAPLPNGLRVAWHLMELTIS